MKPLEHYRFGHAARPFSLVVALVGAALGGWIALLQGQGSVLHLLLIISGALLAQLGINLVNDLEDLSLFGAELSGPAASCIRRNARLGFLAFAVALLIGLYFVLRSGLPLLLLVLFNAVLALNYNLGPLNFKRRGLALLQVFLQMGVMLVFGAYLAMGGEPRWSVIWLSLPVSFLVSLLLLSNELRDYSDDARNGLRTLAVRLGYARAVWAFRALIAMACLTALGLYAADLLARPYYLLLPLLLLPALERQMREQDRRRLTPLTGRFFLLFGLAYIAAL
ncbi:prenyltransferase [Granulosicoccaceae sp. 1_MG-2023]|nr:prenyltransferase [Granulosicoccaceae sp. 1_MG-2023]